MTPAPSLSALGSRAFTYHCIPYCACATISHNHHYSALSPIYRQANKNEVEAVIKEGNMLTYDIVDTATLPFSKQLELIRRTNILVGIHGAGLMLILFAAKESVLIEIHPTYRQDRHFRHASRMVGHTYLPLRAVKRETCHGSSDNVEVPLQEFRRALDGAIRITRNTDLGISECGLICPVEVLSLDDRLVRHYFDKFRLPKNVKANTRFPC